MEKYKRAANWLLLILCFVLVCGYVTLHGAKMLDADMSSEMVLAKHLAEENKLVSPEWWYSTELRVVNTQLVMMPLFKLFENWQTVRAIGTVILLVVYLLCYRFFLGGIGLEKSFPVSGAFLLLPVSIVYFVFVVFGLYYIPHICFSFVLMGLLFRILTKPGKISLLHCALMCLLAFAAGMGGLRQLLVYVIPLCVTAAIMCAFQYIYIYIYIYVGTRKSPKDLSCCFYPCLPLCSRAPATL